VPEYVTEPVDELIPDVSMEEIPSAKEILEGLEEWVKNLKSLGGGLEVEVTKTETESYKEKFAFTYLRPGGLMLKHDTMPKFTYTGWKGDGMMHVLGINGELFLKFNESTLSGFLNNHEGKWQDFPYSDLLENPESLIDKWCANLDPDENKKRDVMASYKDGKVIYGIEIPDESGQFVVYFDSKDFRPLLYSRIKDGKPTMVCKLIDLVDNPPVEPDDFVLEPPVGCPLMDLLIMEDSLANIMKEEEAEEEEIIVERRNPWEVYPNRKPVSKPDNED
jgi:outer membrane lipoprotein-sorting protein